MNKLEFKLAPGLSEEQLSEANKDITIIRGIVVPPELQQQGNLILALVWQNSDRLNQEMADEIDGAADTKFIAILSLLEQLKKQSWFIEQSILREAIANFHDITFRHLRYRLENIFLPHCIDYSKEQGRRGTLDTRNYGTLVAELAAFNQRLIQLMKSPLVSDSAKARFPVWIETVAQEFLVPLGARRVVKDMLEYIIENPA